MSKKRRQRERERVSAQTVWSDVSPPEPAPWAQLGLAAASRSRILLAWCRRFPRAWGIDFPRTTHIICGLCIVSWCGEEYQCE